MNSAIDRDALLCEPDRIVNANALAGFRDAVVDVTQMVVRAGQHVGILQVRNGRAEMRVDRDPVSVRLDADGLEAEPSYTRAPAGCDEQPVPAHFAPAVELEHVVLTVASHSTCITGEEELDALAAQDLAEGLTQRRRLPAKEML